MSPSKRSPDQPIENLAIGSIIEVDGTHVVAEISKSVIELSRIYRGDLYPIGQFGSIVKIHFGRKLLYAYVSRLRMRADYDRERGVEPAAQDARIIEADLFGEAEWIQQRTEGETTWALHFERGVTTFPLPQQIIYLTPREELRQIFGKAGADLVRIGEHVGTGGAPCYVPINDLLGKHTAVLGSTGSGKSGAVASIVHGIMEHGNAWPNWSPRIIILDPHNEYGSAFPRSASLATDAETLKLPYWLLNFDETVSLFIGRTEYAATSQTNILRNAMIASRRAAAETLGLDPDRITVDSPVPYELGDPIGLDIFGKRDEQLETTGLVGAINAQRPDGRAKADHSDYAKIINKIASVYRDSRLSFMMEPWDGNGDLFVDTAMQLLSGDECIRVIDLSAVPNEVAGAASAAIARLIFNIKVWQTSDERATSPVLLVCEEAHRYVPNSGEAQYAAAQDSLRRIAKEGRKYGIGLLLVSQRPSDVEATVLSQCNSWVVLRITNDADRTHVRSVLPDSLAGLTSVLSGLRRREAILVGLAATLPSRILLRELTELQLPRSHDVDFVGGWKQEPINAAALATIGKRWRYQDRQAT